MQDTTQQIIGRMATGLVHQSGSDYFLSGAFPHIGLQEDLSDVWSEALDRSRERPELYGESVLAGALSGFLHHAFHRRPEAFPALVVQILDGVAVSERVPLAPDAIEKDLLDLGYPSADLEPLFSGLREREQDRQRRRAEECR